MSIIQTETSRNIFLIHRDVLDAAELKRELGKTDDEGDAHGFGKKSGLNLCC